MPLLLVFTPAPKPARGADMDQPCNQVEVYSRCGLAVFLVLNFPVQKLSNLSIKVHLGEVDTMQCLLSLYDLQEGYHDRPGGGQDHQDATGSQSCFFMFNGYVLKY